ncbi:phosphatase PAP2 family protein [Paenibacillus radicis (ex Gao et al. 2016)]|uniref:Phosphatidylglycerophosphatase B n=1 Tax=Paenibacillus radicis (ex Gao et al. 2016) TaxID=1737354 RepID=A0A917GW80_9BACL|nr:phosphatase PAP2 family protein [Paenibacillus radicis (ex Gao et al. 2016)]GGG58283.1 phosphatidylglycerophosphatase B [Paenibacillus radicis (ex Gao et al. 2016)]
MNLKFVFTASFIISLIGAIGFALIAVLIGKNNIEWFDSQIITFVQHWESPWLTSVMKGFSLIGAGTLNVIITILIMIMLYFVFKHRWELLFLIGVIVGSALLNVVLKAIFHRARPTLHRLADATGYSFPSGHSMAAFALYGVLCFLLWKHARTALTRTLLIVGGIVMIAAIGISRIYLGVHYPSDVIGGYLASGTWLAVTIWFYQRWLERRSTRRV